MKMAVIEQAGSMAANVFLMVLIVIFVGGGVAGGIWLYFYWKKYNQFICRIWEKDGFGNIIETRDQAGIFVDRKTKNKRLFLRKMKVGLEPDNIPAVPTTKGNKVIYLMRVGLKNFRFLKPDIDVDNVDFSVTEEDVNWAVNEYDRVKKTFNQNIFTQYILPFMFYGLIVVFILGLFVVLFKDFVPAMTAAANAINEAAQALAQVNSGVIIQ